MSLVRQIAGLKEEQAQLQATSNILQILQQQLTEAQTQVKLLHGKWENALREQGEVNSKQKTAQQMWNQARNVWDDAPLSQAQIALLACWRQQALGSTCYRSNLATTTSSKFANGYKNVSMRRTLT